MSQELKLLELLGQVQHQENKTSFDISTIAFKQQLDFINDKAKLKALFCTRRAAKSYTGGIYLIKEALETPRCNVLFIGLTRLTSHGIIWKDILKELDRNHKLNIKFNETVLQATLPNESVIYVAGADTDEDEMNKLLGKKYKLVVIDEASMFSINMRQLVYGILKPATADQRGTICLLGTAANITSGLFYDITTAKEPGWSLHTWTAYDNPFVAKQWQEEIDDIQKNRPQFMETALFQQWYLNRWVVDEEARVYRYSSRNCCDYLPRDLSDWNYVLGCDLAHSPDSTAFVVGAYHPLDPKLYITYARKHLRMDITDASNEINRLNTKYNFMCKIVDGANKMAVAELNNRHHQGLICADKIGKPDFIKLMNDEFIQGKVLLLPDARQKWTRDDQTLEDEYNTLVWVTDNGKVVEPRKENPNQHNDLADAALYMWRYCYTYLYKVPDYKPKWDTQERWEPEHIHKLEEQVKKEQDPYRLELDFDPELFEHNDDDYKIQ